MSIAFGSALSACAGVDSDEEGVATAAASGAGTQVSLRTAQVNHRQNMFTYQASLKGTVDVANLAYEKKVALHYQVRTNQGVVQSWTTVEARWASGEVWEFETPAFPGECPHYCRELLFDFAIAYEVLGRTYWDNNGGRNYLMSADASPIPGSTEGPTLNLGDVNVELSYAELTGGDGALHGQIALRNLAYEKRVTLEHSADGWRTVQNADASFTRMGQTGYEYWRFDVPLGAEVERIAFAVKYEVGGQTYWDNNLDRDYARTRQ